jgi:hypothetical protein
MRAVAEPPVDAAPFADEVTRATPAIDRNEPPPDIERMVSPDTAMDRGSIAGGEVESAPGLPQEVAPPRHEVAPLAPLAADAPVAEPHAPGGAGRPAWRRGRPGGGEPVSDGAKAVPASDGGKAADPFTLAAPGDDSFELAWKRLTAGGPVSAPSATAPWLGAAVSSPSQTRPPATRRHRRPSETAARGLFVSPPEEGRLHGESAVGGESAIRENPPSAENSRSGENPRSGESARGARCRPPRPVGREDNRGRVGRGLRRGAAGHRGARERAVARDQGGPRAQPHAVAGAGRRLHGRRGHRSLLGLHERGDPLRAATAAGLGERGVGFERRLAPGRRP